jgi:hypothetical protein
MKTIYVKLLDEGTDVWRPVAAEMINDSIYRLVGERADGETWEFEAGSMVRVEERQSESDLILVAVEETNE